MRFHILSIPIALLMASTKVIATYVTISTTITLVIPFTSMTMVTNDGSKFEMTGSNDAVDGCRTNGVKDLEEFCMDTGRKRAHFKWKNQSFKRCLKQTSSSQKTCGGDEGCWEGVCQTCINSRYDETPCTW